MAIAMAIGGTACAPTTYAVTPLASSGVELRFNKGTATAFAARETSAVQVTPLGVNSRGRLEFAVAAFNDGTSPINFGVENVSVTVDDVQTRLFTHLELSSEARRDATTAAIIIAVAGGVSAYAAQQNAYSTGTGSVTSRFGTSTYTYRQYNPTAAAIGSASATAGTAIGLQNVSNALDATLTQLGDSILQTTTIDPDDAYGGRIVTDRVHPENPLAVLLRVTLGEDVFDFPFSVMQSAK